MMRNFIAVTSLIITASDVFDNEEMHKNAHKDSKLLGIHPFSVRSGQNIRGLALSLKPSHEIKHYSKTMT